eukprot:Tbor_TRINITY_DN5528_c2_g1::TRINITY_DN5528_c2_g1_i1::g.13104::m.13104
MRKQANEQDSMNGMRGDTNGGDKEVTARKYDEKAAADRMRKINESIAAKLEQKAKKDKEIAARVVPDEDVELLSAALAVDKKQAKTILQMNKGNLTNALKEALVP